MNERLRLSKTPPSRLGLWLGLAALSGLGYLAIALAATPLGFPLDDAWIHQVFARNLARHAEFSYNPGQPVAGSTSPLWTLLLVPGQLFEGVLMLPWAYALGWLFLALTAREGYLLTRLLGGKSGPALAVGLFLTFEWRLAWAGTSGMETILFTFGSLFLLRQYLRLTPLALTSSPTFAAALPTPGSPALPLNLRTAFFLGLAGGLLTLVRPEGMVLLGLIGVDWGWRQRGQWGKLGREWACIALGWLVAAVPYFLLNYALSGSPLPNTFGAKVSGYADGSAEGISRYLGQALFQLFLGGPGLLLLPGFGLSLRMVFKGKLDGRLLVWPPVLLLLYTLRLPVTYQHARYLMPLVPFLVIYGLIGTFGLIEWLRGRRLPVLARALLPIVALAVALAWVIGGLIYQRDTQIINDEQVRVGRWLAANTPPGATVATHDIGAITYFSGRRVVDTAGLISPEFVPIVRDQPAILARLEQLKVDYFAFLPTWYDKLYEELEKTNRKVFQPQESYLEALGEKNMAVYRLR